MRSLIVALAALAVVRAGGGDAIPHCGPNQQFCKGACISRAQVCHVSPPRRACNPATEKPCGSVCIPRGSVCHASH
jgi:hypothetical protein